MKLIRFQDADDSRIHFGLAHQGRALAFAELASHFAVDPGPLSSIDAFARHWPDSLTLAQQLLSRWDAADDTFKQAYPALTERRLLAPIERPALLADYAIAPAHLRNSARTLMKYEMPRWLGGLAGHIAQSRYKRPPQRRDLKFYMGSCQPFVGPDECLGWPSYSRYVDPEAELAVICAALPLGADDERCSRAIIGYSIFCDLSARDLQFPEMGTGTLGFMRTKHFDRSNGLGPCIVTTDELQQPADLAVSVDIGDRLHWQGSTRDYAFAPAEVLAELASICSLPALSVIGLGTVPGCCGLDVDQWARPGESLSIEIQGIGRLTQRLDRPSAAPDRPRWPRRQDWPSDCP